MGGRFFVVGVFAGATALGLLTGCPATPPSDPRGSDQVDVTAVDRASVIPPFGPDATRADFVQGDFYWSRERPPGTPLGPVHVAGLRRLIETELPDRLFPRVDMSLATTLGSPAEARQAADEIRARLSGHLTRYDVREAVAVLGHSVVVRGVTSPSARRSVRRLLSGYGGRVLVEGDRFGEGAIVTDLNCRPTDRQEAAVVVRDLSTYATALDVFQLRPPWVGPALTAQERLARSTYPLFADATMRAMGEDTEMAALSEGYLEALYSGDKEGVDRFIARMHARRLELAPRRLDRPYDPPTLRLLLAEPYEGRARDAWGARVGVRMGRLALTRHDNGTISLRSRASAIAPALLTVRQGSRLDVSGFLPLRNFAPTLASLLLYLDRSGCRDFRYRLLDWDTVRGD